MEKITQSKLKELLKYYPCTGIFRWNVVRGGAYKTLSKAGCAEKKRGYIVIGINGVKYSAHRLAWLYVYGYFPENHIDHINKKTNDNRIVNLRVVSRQCNNRNMSNKCSNKSGVKGVFFRDNIKKWTAQIGVNNKNYTLGSYIDFDEAVLIRFAAEQCLNWNKCDSQSPAYKYLKKNKLIKPRSHQFQKAAINNL